MKKYIFSILGFFTLLPVGVKSSLVQIKNNEMKGESSKNAVFAGGCFWCTEAMFSQLKGVKKVVSGYSGGNVDNPTYEQVCTGKTGHAECTRITYDPGLVTFAELLEVFWMTHDPTTLNRQGADSCLLYTSDAADE